MKLLPPHLVLIGVALIAVSGLVLPGPELLQGVWRLTGVLPGALGVGLLAAGSGLFRRLGTNIRTFDEPGVLVVDGPFRFSRNPMYLGFSLVLLGLALGTGHATPLAIPAAFFAVANLWYVPFEERAMHAKFGPDYEQYRRTTRRWI